MVAAQDGRVRPGTSHLERHHAFRGTDSKTARRYGVAKYRRTSNSFARLCPSTPALKPGEAA
jgi:hypothetical protein